jgi:hypothetical protein
MATLFDSRALDDAIGLKRTVGSTRTDRTQTTMRHDAALMVLTSALRVQPRRGKAGSRRCNELSA